MEITISVDKIVSQNNKLDTSGLSLAFDIYEVNSIMNPDNSINPSINSINVLLVNPINMPLHSLIQHDERHYSKYGYQNKTIRAEDIKDTGPNLSVNKRYECRPQRPGTRNAKLLTLTYYGCICTPCIVCYR